MLDFTSVLYLGFHHPASSLPAWSQLTTGVPAALAEPRSARRVARQLARLQGCEAAVLGRSTLHVFWDLFAMLTSDPVAIFVDGGAYPIAGWAAAATAGQVPVRHFAHGDVDRLARLLQRHRRRRPLIVTDGRCRACGCSTPVGAYLALARAAGGLLLLDDTQALGLLGAGPTATTPYGQGGGGTLRHLALHGPDIILVSSLAKAFGAPLAALSGSSALVQRFRAQSKTRVHSSPPSLATIHAAGRALALNQTEGEQRRAALVQRVRHFRRRLQAGGLTTSGGLFPVQTLALPAAADARRLHRRLLAAGVRAVLREGCEGRPAVTFVLTALHRRADVERATATVLANCSTQSEVYNGFLHAQRFQALHSDGS